MVAEKLTDVCASAWRSDSTNDVLLLSSNFTNPKANFTTIFFLFTYSAKYIRHLDLKVICSFLFKPDPLRPDPLFLARLRWILRISSGHNEINKINFDSIHERYRGYHMPARGYEFYLQAFNSISHEWALRSILQVKALLRQENSLYVHNW